MLQISVCFAVAARTANAGTILGVFIHPSTSLDRREVDSERRERAGNEKKELHIFEMIFENAKKGSWGGWRQDVADVCGMVWLMRLKLNQKNTERKWKLNEWEICVEWCALSPLDSSATWRRLFSSSFSASWKRAQAWVHEKTYDDEFFWKENVMSAGWHRMLIENIKMKILTLKIVKPFSSLFTLWVHQGWVDLLHIYRIKVDRRSPRRERGRKYLVNTISWASKKHSTRY